MVVGIAPRVRLSTVVAGLVFALGCSQDAAQPAQAVAEPGRFCVPSWWLGALEHAGDEVVLDACVGEVCSGRFEVDVQQQDSCFVPFEDGGGPPPGVTPRPSGELLRDLTTRVYSEDNTEFSVCILRSHAEIDTVDIELEIRLGSNGSDAGAELATLQIRSADDEILVDASTRVEDAEECPAFRVNLDGQPLEE